MKFNLEVSDTPKYNITSSNENKFMWFRVAKAGTRSILQILNENKISFALDGYDLTFEPAQYKSYFKFAFVRNPWERVVSCYANKVVPNGLVYYQPCVGKSFGDFIDFIKEKDLRHADSHIRLQTSLIPLAHVDFIGRFENFVLDVKRVATILQLNLHEVPKSNPSSHSHYSNYYCERTRNIIATLYKKDIDTFGYQFEYDQGTG